ENGSPAAGDPGGRAVRYQPARRPVLGHEPLHPGLLFLVDAATHTATTTAHQDLVDRRRRGRHRAADLLLRHTQLRQGLADLAVRRWEPARLRSGASDPAAGLASLGQAAPVR